MKEHINIKIDDMKKQRFRYGLVSLQVKDIITSLLPEKRKVMLHLIRKS